MTRAHRDELARFMDECAASRGRLWGNQENVWEPPQESQARQAEPGDNNPGHLLQQGGDSNGFSIVQYEDWEDAKRGLVSEHKFIRMHVMVDANGEESHVLRGYERYDSRFSQARADVCRDV